MSVRLKTMTEDVTIFELLKEILSARASRLKVVTDKPGLYYLDTKVLDAKGKAIFFGMVKEGKAKVSFHLMLIYSHPELLDQISEDLRNRMQGKSCFTFSKHSLTLFDELSLLVDLCLEEYIAEGLA